MRRVPTRPSFGRPVPAALAPVRSVLRRLGEHARPAAGLALPAGVALLSLLSAGVLAGVVAAASDGLVGLLAARAAVVAAAGVGPSAAARVAAAMTRDR